MYNLILAFLTHSCSDLLRHLLLWILVGCDRGAHTFAFEWGIKIANVPRKYSIIVYAFPMQLCCCCVRRAFFPHHHHHHLLGFAPFWQQNARDIKRSETICVANGITLCVEDFNLVVHCEWQTGMSTKKITHTHTSNLVGSDIWNTSSFEQPVFGWRRVEGDANEECRKKN